MPIKDITICDPSFYNTLMYMHLLFCNKLGNSTIFYTESQNFIRNLYLHTNFFLNF